jgi:transcription antitermination factor NusB
VKAQTLARELALKALYQHDLLGGRSLEDLMAFCIEYGNHEAAQESIEIVKGCIENAEALDDLIRRTAENWDLERMAATDRNVLRIGVFELLFRNQTPPKVAIDEAIELAKKYSTQNSPTFVNGILDGIYNTRVLGAAAGSSAPPAPPGDAMARCDLHMHSTASDGSVDPAELPALAARAGLAAIALTDHDSVQGVAAAREAAQAVGIEVVPGVELTAYAGEGEDRTELHMVGLFVDCTSPDLLARLRSLRRGRVTRLEKMVRALAALDMPVDTEAVLARSHGGAVGRLHVAQEMVKRGYCADLREAFDLHIGEGRPAYVPREQMTPAEGIELIHAAGGCAVLSHPGLAQGIDGMIELLVEAGLDAIEVHCPAHTAEDEKRFMDLAQEHGLVVAGGSDFHGEARPDVRIGQETISGVELDQLRRRAATPAR